MAGKSQGPDQTITSQHVAEWVDAHGDYLYNFAVGRLMNHDLAADVVQETFMAALKAKDRFERRSSVRTWLTSILRHKIVDLLRRKYREQPVTDLAQEQQTIDSFFDHTIHFKQAPTKWQADPLELLKNKEFWNVLQTCIDKLSVKGAHAFMLREIDGHTGPEVCDIMNISRANFWTIMHRVRLQLRACLEKRWFAAE